MKTPILFLLFNRPQSTLQVFEAIRLAEPQKLYVAADGPRFNNAEDELMCTQTRAIIQKVDWPCEVITLFREQNLGCKIAVSSAIDWFFEQEEEGIILEDDCLPHPTFFTFCETMLDYYRNDERIMHIGGTNFLDGQMVGQASYYFSNIHHIWGWATWRRAWSKYDVELNLLPAFVENGCLENIFSNKAHQKFLLNTFDLIKSGELNTWDFQWLLAIWVNHGLGIIPNKNLVSNIGFNENGTHTKNNKNNPLANRTTESIGNLTHPILMFPNAKGESYTIDRYLIGGIKNKFKQKIKSILR